MTVTVERFLVVTNVGVVDCAQPQTACGIGAADVFAPGGSAVIQPMVFTPQPPVTDPFDARIAGTVTDSSSAPVPGTKVFAYRSTDGLLPSLQTTTDGSGNYVLENAEPGIAYRLRFGVADGVGPGDGVVRRRGLRRRAVALHRLGRPAHRGAARPRRRRSAGGGGHLDWNGSRSGRRPDGQRQCLGVPQSGQMGRLLCRHDRRRRHVPNRRCPTRHRTADPVRAAGGIGTRRRVVRQRPHPTGRDPRPRRSRREHGSDAQLAAGP